MYNLQVIINLVVIVLTTTVISIIGVDMKEPYPPNVIKWFLEPYFRVICYFFLYFLALYNGPIALLYTIAIILLHIDYVNLVQ